MNNAQDNVTRLNIEPVRSECNASEVTPAEDSSSTRDMGRIALVVSLLSVVLSVIFFFGLNRNLSGLSDEVKDIGTIRTTVAALDVFVDDILEQMGRVNTRIMELEEQPRKEAVKVLQESMINDMLRRTEFMGEQLATVDPENDDRAQKLERLKDLLEEFKTPPLEGVLQ